ncbi:MAG: hypothetical protein AAGI37_15425 [Planctomycetota bacterium]
MATRFWDHGASTGNLGTASNWSADTVPVANDTVWFEGISSGSNIDTGLSSTLDNATLSGNLDALYISAAATYAFGTDSAYLVVGVDECEIGFWRQQGSRPNGSPRLKLDFGNQATECRVYSTAGTTTDTNLDPTRLLFNNSSARLDVYSDGSACRVGVATTDPAETSTLGTLNVYGLTAGVTCGPGVALTTANVYGGNALLQSAPTTANVRGGTLKITAYTGTVTNAEVKSGATLDIRGSNLTFTNPIELHDGAILDARGFTGSLLGKLRFMGSGAVTILTDAEVTV